MVDEAVPGSTTFEWLEGGHFVVAAFSHTYRKFDACQVVRLARVYARAANAALTDSGGNRLKEEQTLVRVVLDDLSDKAEAVAVADGVRGLGAGEIQVEDVHILELEGWPRRRFRSPVPGGDEDVVSSVVVAVIRDACDGTVELDGPAAVLGCE